MTGNSPHLSAHISAQNARTELETARLQLQSINTIIEATREQVGGGEISTWCAGLVIDAVAKKAVERMDAAIYFLDVLEDIAAPPELPF